MRKLLKSCLLSLLFLTSCLGRPTPTVLPPPTLGPAPTFAPSPMPTFTPTLAPTILPTSTVTPRLTLTQPPLTKLSQLSIQKVEKPSLQVEFGDLTTLHGEYFIFTNSLAGNSRTPPPDAFQNYKYQSWTDPQQQGRLFDFWRPLGDVSPDRVLPEFTEVIFFDAQSNFWVAAQRAGTYNKDKLIKLDLPHKKFDLYAFVSPCAVDVNGNQYDKVKGREFPKPLALEYFPVFVSDCPQPGENGLALFSLTYHTITHFFPLGSPQYPTLYQTATWLTPETLALVSKKDVCVLKLTSPDSPCRKFPYTLLTLPLLSPDGNWLIRKEGKYADVIDPLDCPDRTYILCDPSQLDPARVPYAPTDFRFSAELSYWWSPDSLRIATIHTSVPDLSVTSQAPRINFPISIITGIYLLSPRQSQKPNYGRLPVAGGDPTKLIWSSQNENIFLIDIGWLISILNWRTGEGFGTEGRFQGVFFIP